MSSIIKGITDEQHITKKEPEVHVPGYGTMPLDMLKRHVKELSKDFDTLIQQGAFLKAAYRSEQFYNALMALAKALPKPDKVDETHSTGTTVGSAGIGGGAGLGIDKSPIEKVIEKPLGEGELPPKAGFNPKPVKIDREGPDTPDNYEYKSFIPRDSRERGEEWAIKRDIRRANARAKSKPKLVPDTGFYKNYLNNRPIREEDLDEATKAEIRAELDQAIKDFLAKGGEIEKLKPNRVRAKPGMGLASKHIGTAGEINHKTRSKMLVGKGRKIQGNKPEVSVEEEQAPMFTPEQTTTGFMFDLGDRIKTKFSRDAAQNITGTVISIDPKTKKIIFKTDSGKKYFSFAQNLEKIKEDQIANINDRGSDGWRVYKAKPAGTKESSIMKGLQEDLLAEGNPVNVWAAIRPHGGIPPNLRASRIPVDKLPSLGFGSGDARDKSNYIRYYYDIMKGNAKYQLDKDYEKKGKIPDIEKIESYLAKLARSAGLEQDANGKWFFDASSMTKEMKSHLTYLEYNFGIPKKYKPKQKKPKDESE